MSEGDPTPKNLREVMRANYDDIIDFLVMPGFKDLVEKMYKLDPQERPGFVNDVIVNRDELKNRGIDVPQGILIQRSSFGDGRPTLFVIKKYLPEAYRQVWENVNITFDQTVSDNQIPTDQSVWKKPLPIATQAAVQAMGLSLDQVKTLTGK